MPTVPGVATNPYLQTVQARKDEEDTLTLQSQIPTGGGASDNPYMLQLMSREHDAEVAARAAVLPAVDTNPDEYAGHLALAKESNLPVGVVQTDPQTIARDQRLNRIVDTIAKSPTLQAWTAIDDNAVLAMDDFENLSGLETAMRSTRDYFESPFRGFNKGLGSGIKGVGDLLDAFAFTADQATFGTEHAEQYLKDAAAAPWWVNPSNALRGVGGYIESLNGADLPADRRTLGTDIGEGFGTLIAQALTTRLNPTAGVTLMAGQGADQQADQADKAGASAEQKAKAVVLGAAITAASEKLGLDLLLDRLPPNIKNKAARWIVDKTLAAGIEGTEEAVEQVGNNIVAQMLYDPNNPIFEGVSDNATVGAGVGFLARSLLGLRGVGHERQNVTSEQTALDGMVTAAGASKLLQRAPERFQALVAQMAQAGATNVYIPAEDATKLFQSMTPPQVAEALGVPVETYMEAVITGGDVAIPVEQYLSRVAPEHHEALREVARFTPGAMTPAEAVEMDERAAEAADRFMASVQSEMPSDQMVHDDVTGMLLGTGRYRREDVERYAQLVQAGFRTLAAREGMDPFALYQRYRLRIKSELPAALQSMDIDTVIDPLIERLRSGDVPRGTKRQTLADFIAAGGGVDDAALSGEIRTLNESDRVVRKGKAPLVRKGAERDLDRVREAAAEAGYLPMDSDINDLLALLENEMAGQPTYAMGDEADSPDDRTIAALDSLDEELSRQGIDVSTTSNADIKRALFGERGNEVPDALVQVFDQPDRGMTAREWQAAAREFVRNSVVKKVVYHATAADFDAFDTTKSDLGAHFGSKEQANHIAERRIMPFGNRPASIMPVYINLENPLRLKDEGSFHADAIADQLARKGIISKVEAKRIKAEGWRENKKNNAIVRDAIKAAGYDGVVYKNTQERSEDNWIAFEPGQIKSATANSGAFDPNNPSILHQSGDPLDKRNQPASRSAHEAARSVSDTLEALAAIGGRVPAAGWVAATVVRGADGNPAVIHRGSRDGTTSPDDFEQLGASTGHPSASLGVWLSSDAADAGKYGQVGDYFLDLRNPKEYTAADFPGFDDAEEAAALRDELIADGHDGIVMDAREQGGPVHFVVFAPEQVIPRGEGAAAGSFDADTNASDDGFDEIEYFQSGDQTQTPEFKAWFGESKVVDADGKPLVVYHGTDAKIEAFDPNKTQDGVLWFTANRDGLEAGEVGAAGRSNIIPVYLSAKNLAGWEQYESLTIDQLIAAGYDGVKLDDDYIVFNPEQIKSATANRGTFDPNNPSILHQPADGSPAENAIRRGYIKFGPERHFTVGLLEKADATTFLHETGHFFLEVMGDLAADPLASDAIRSDYATLLSWFGVSSREQITVEHHEQFARGFEQYLGEGKAPNPELASAFARFKAWVKAIYRTLNALNVPLTDDVRGVMDRLLATDEEITQAETSMDYAGLFADARSAGWSDAEFATRLQLQEQAREEAETRLMARAMKDVTRETKAWWKERSAEVREQVTKDVHQLPVYRAWALLANGTQPDGTPIEGAGQKLDKAWLVQQYGQEWLNKHLLRKRVYSVAGGADPDVIALGVGFGSGDEMVRALANMQPMEAVIRAQTHQSMVDQYGDVLTDGTMPEQAMRAVHGSRRFRAMEADLKALERLAGDPRPSATGLRRTAELIVGQKKVRDLAPNTYLRAERKAAKEAIKASGQQKWGEALEAQRRRLLNAHLYDVASKAVTETEKLQRYLKRFEKPALRARLGRIGRLDQVETLLAQYDLRTVSNKKIDQAKARGELLKLIADGEVIAPPGFVASLQGGQRTNWRDLSVEDLRGLRDILAQTEAAARAEYEALVNGEKVKLDDIAEQVGSSTIDGGKPVMPIYGDLSPDESAKKWGKQMLASWLRPSALARLLDGGKDDGAWTRHVIQPIRRAVSEQLEPMKRKAHEDLAALYRKHYTVKEMAAMNERSVVPGLGLALSRWDQIALVLNMGNAENRKALLDSEVAGKKPYTEAGLQAVLTGMDARDLAFVQDAWDLVDSYWPAIKAAQVRRKGIAPPKVEAQPFTVTTRDGQTVAMKGGYYPLKYNGRLDAKARQHEMDEAFERMRAGTLSATQTKYGHTQERVGSGRQPVMLSMTVLHSHINNVVMDLALGDVVNYTDRLLARPQVRQALIETGNLDALDTWKLWLKDTATGEIGARSGADQLAQFIRFGFTKSKVGFNAMTMILQLTGLAQTIPVVGAGHTAAAALDFAGRPRAAIKQVMAESAFMRTRYELNAFNKDIAAVQDALRSGAPVGRGTGFLAGFIAAVKAVQMPPALVNWAFLGIRQMQILVDSTTWLAGYRRAAGEGKSHAEAVAYADGIVENAQTSGMFSDRSAIERGTLSDTTRQSEFVKLWTTLMSYMIAKGNIAFESYRRTDFKNPRAVLSFGTDVTLLFAAEALLMGLIKGGLPDDDDDESWWSWTGKTIATQAISTIPFVREVPGMKYGGGNTPIGSTAKDLYTAIQQTGQFFDEDGKQYHEVDEALVKSYVNLIGTATGLPAAQINRAIDAYWNERPAVEYVTGKRQ